MTAMGQFAFLMLAASVCAVLFWNREPLLRGILAFKARLREINDFLFGP